MLLGAQPTEELVHVAEIARDEEEVVDASVVEVREVEARAEDAPAGVARVGDDRAADHAHLDLRVEQREVDGDLGRRQRVAVLRVQVPVVPDLEIRSTAAALEIGAAEIGDAGRAEVVEPREPFLRRSQHRPDEMRAAPRRGEHEREEQSLRSLDALLLGQGPRPLGRHLRACRHEAGEAFGRRVDKRLIAHRPAQIVGERGVDRLRVCAQERGALGVERRLQLGRRLGLRLGPLRAGRQAPEQFLAAYEVRARGRARRLEGGRLLGRARAPLAHLRLKHRQARTRPPARRS